MTEKIILLASHNKGKVKEFNELLSPYGFKAVPADELGIDMEKAQETAPNFRGNSLIKATYAYQQSEEGDSQATKHSLYHAMNSFISKHSIDS